LEEEKESVRNNRMKVVVTDYDYPFLDLERKVLEEIDP
jgi:hypothetical protein